MRFYNKSVSAIMAINMAGYIGKGDGFPWPNLPTDMARFARYTRGKTVVMGRRTFETIGGPLPDRQNIVVTSSNLTHPGIAIARTLEEAIESAGSPITREVDQVVLIGGRRIYEEGFPMCEEILITRVQNFEPGDTKGPDVPAEFECVEQRYAQDGHIPLIFRKFTRR